MKHSAEETAADMRRKARRIAEIIGDRLDMDDVPREAETILFALGIIAGSIITGAPAGCGPVGFRAVMAGLALGGGGDLRLEILDASDAGPLQ